LGGYGGEEDWCRSEEDSVPGAGLFFPAGPAPQFGLLRSPVALVSDKKADLRQSTHLQLHVKLNQESHHFSSETHKSDVKQHNFSTDSWKSLAGAVPFRIDSIFNYE